MKNWNNVKNDPQLANEYRAARRASYRINADKKRQQNSASYHRRKTDPARALQIKESAQRYKSSPRGLLLHRAKEARRRAINIKATPPWANLELIKEFYLKCPPGLEVDHIIPLQGKTVCGLHVHYNLQYLTETENCKKSNKLILPPQDGR